MKKYILSLIIASIAICYNFHVSAQTCPEVQDKSIILQGSVNGPCAIYTARDYITLKTGFTLSGGTKIVQFNWGTGSGGSTPQIKIGSSPYCFGIALPVNFNMSDLMNSITALKNSLISTLGSGYIVNMSLCGTSCAWISVENLSDFTYSGVYSSATVTRPFQLPNTSFTAKVDNSLLFPVSYLSSFDIPDLTSRQPNTNLPFGSTAGAFNVSPTGAATYEIPIAVPPGLGGLEPKVSIAYNSQSGNGLLGWGCNLTGLSAITRVPKNLYSDNVVTGLGIDNEDRFALDGNRLVIASGTYGASDATYRTENETFMHIISKDTYGINSPAYFEVYDKKGTKYKYGSQGGRSLYNSGSKIAVLTWYLDYVEDIFGNTISYTYTSDQNGLVVYLKTITYGTNKAGMGTASTVDFFYETRQDPINFHYFPLNGQIDKVLFKVVTKTGNQVLRTYDLEYTEDAFTRLSKITESNGSGEKLNPTYLKWGDYKSVTINQCDYTLPIDSYYSQVDFSQRKWSTGDVNGDGLTDLISIFQYTQPSSGYKSNIFQPFLASLSSNGSLYFTLASSYGFLDGGIDYNDFKSYSSSPFIQNLNGDNFPDIIVPNFNKWYYGCQIKFFVLNYSIINPVLIQDLLPSTDAMPTYTIADINNDGIQDIIYIENSKLNNLYQGKIHYGTSNPNWTNPIDNVWIPFNIDLNKPAKNIFIGDYNEDGLNDVMVVNDDGYYIYPNINGTINPTPVATSTLFNSTYSQIRPGDFNADGLQDFVLNERDSPNWYFAINNGNLGFTKIPLPLITASGQDFTDYDNTVDNCLVTDFNNDGKSDLIVFDGSYDKHCNIFGNNCWGSFNNFKTYWYQSTGNNVSLVKTATSTNAADAPYSLYVVGDFNGDGRSDLMNFGYDCYGGIDMTQKWCMYATPNTNYEGGMVSSISNGLGQNTSIAYTTTAAKTNYSVDASLPSGNPTYPLSYLGNSAYLVKSVTTPNGVSSNIVQNYSYTNGVVDLQRGFMGFGKFTVTNPTLNASTEQNYEFKYNPPSSTTTYYQPFLTSTKNKVGATVISESVIPLATYSVSAIPGSLRHAFMYPTVTMQTDNLKQTLTTSTTSMDNDGNVFTSLSQITDNLNQSVIVSSKKSTFNGYNKRDNAIANPNPFKNAPDNVVSEQTHKDTPGNTFTVTTAFTYNTNNGTLKDKTDFSGSANNALTTSYTYDEVGNMLTTSTGDRSTTLEYTFDKRFVKKQINTLTHYTEADYDSWGNPLTKWDVNRLQTDYLYDSWGRLISVTAPDGRKVISSVYWFDKGNASSYKPASTLYYTSSYDEDNHFIGAEYFDAAGHSLRKTEGGFNGRISNSDAAYTPLGQVYTVTDPYPAGTTATKITTSTYDAYSRLHTQTLPNGVVITTTPSDDNTRKITTSYSTGETYSKEYDAAGLLSKATDPGGSITYTYYSNGKPKTIQPAGGAGATQITYSAVTGLQETLNDPSAGLSSYSYNNYAELASQTDANTKTTSMVYDQVGRLKTKTTGTVATTYNYDDTGAIGLVKNITKTDGTGMAYKYDALCRVTEETRSKGTDAFTYKYEYDIKSRVIKLTYPNAMALTYWYNSLSDDLTSIYKDGAAIWSLGTTTTDVNDLGQIAKVTLGNGKATLYGYDTQNRLSNIAVDNIVNFAYTFNDKQQLLSRDEKMFNGITMVGFKESFTYDPVNRLETAIKDNGNTPLTMTYMAGANDRIATKSDAASYNYPDVTKYKIDNISNLKALFPRHDLTYNDEGHTTLVTETNAGIINKFLALEYGLDGQRFKTEYTQDGSRKYTRYYFDNYEKEVMADNTSRHLNYIYAGGSLIAICEQKNNTDIMHYVYADYLGSLRCITNATGTIEQRLSYDAWGSRRDYQTGLKLSDSQITMATTLTSRGFTGQEHIDGMGLINLNARFYEPALGIFLSPDNYLQAPDNSQNFNRYTYCLNNPLMYTDKDGEFWNIIIGAVIGGYSGWKIGKAHGAKGWDMFGYIAGGAVIGGLSGGAASGISAAGGGAMLAGAGAGAIGGAGFSGLSTGWNGEAMLKGAAFGAISGFVGGGVGGAIGGGWGALAGGASANLTNQLLYDGGDFSSVNWESVAFSGITSLGLYHANSFARWQWAGGKKFGDVNLKYGAFNKLNAVYTRSKFWYREGGGWITNEGKFVSLNGAVNNKLSINMNNVIAPSNARYLVHTHYQMEGWLYRQNGNDYAAEPYEPSNDPDYSDDFDVINHYNVDGMILTNKSLLTYYKGTTNFQNNWEYPLLRFIPLYFW